MHLRALLGFTAAVRKKQLTVFTLWGFPVAALAFQILRKNVRLHCVNVRVTKKLTARQISPVVMQESCEVGDAIQPGRRVALRDELQGNQRETPRLYLFSWFEKTHPGQGPCLPWLTGSKEGAHLWSRDGRGRWHCRHIRNPCGCWGQGKLLCWGQHLPAARHSLGFARHGARTASPSFPCNCCEFGREHLLCDISVSWLCALSDMAVPGEGEVGEGRVEMVTCSSMGSGTKGWGFKEEVIKGTGEIQTGRDLMALARCQEEKACIFYLCLPWLCFILSLPIFLIYGFFLATLLLNFQAWFRETCVYYALLWFLS